MFASIPYSTFPEINIGPLGLRTFGLMVALGVLIGARVGSDYSERFGVNREDTYRTGILMVIAGIVGSRLTWVLTNLDQIDDPVDVIAIWEGGIQFAGGFIAALIVGWPMFRRWTKAQRWHVLNGYAYGLTLGVAIGRIGCYAVGEHFGRQSDFFLATRWEGGVPPDVREPALGTGADGVPIVDGVTFHNTALYELLWLLALFLVMTVWIWRTRRKGNEVLPVTFVALFMGWYGAFRFLTDALRVNDERVLSMTGAQWMSLFMVPYAVWLWVRTRPKVAKLVGPDGRPLDTGDTDDTDDDDGVPDELEPPENSAKTSDAKASDDTDTEPGSETEPGDETATASGDATGDEPEQAPAAADS
jgi:phosphatidylglycerol---prolipoprotein diacylglyceryl transferase